MEEFPNRTVIKYLSISSLPPTTECGPCIYIGAMYIRSCVCGVSDDILYKLKQRCSPRFFHTGVITATKFSTFCRPKQSHESLRIPPQTLGSPQSEISIAIRKWKGMPHVCHYPKPLLLRATSVPSGSAYPVCSCHFVVFSYLAFFFSCITIYGGPIESKCHYHYCSFYTHRTSYL